MHRIFLLAIMGLLFATEVTAQPASKTDTPPSDDVLLKQLAGDSTQRLKAFRWVGSRLSESPDAFYLPITKCMDDEDAKVRRSAVMNIGQFMVWNQGEDTAPDPDAIQFLLKHTHDEDFRVIYNCVYYGLSASRIKSDAVIDRLIDCALMRKSNEPLSMLQRVSWGLAFEPEKTTARIQRRLDELKPADVSHAEMLVAMHWRIAKEYPTKLDRFKSTSTYMMYLSVTPPFFPNDKEEVEQRLKKRMGDDAMIERIHCTVERGNYLCIVLMRGLGNYANAVKQFSEGRDFRIAHEMPPVSIDDAGLKQLAAQFEKQANREVPAAAFEAPFRELYDTLGKRYPNFELKGIDWDAVGEELLPRSKSLQSQAQFCLLCQELVARLEDSHAYLMKGTAEPVHMPAPRFDPGFACLIDDQNRPVVYHIDHGSPAEKAGLKVGMVVTMINGQSIEEIIAKQMTANRKYVGYSSERYLRYQTARWLGRRRERGEKVRLTVLDNDGKRLEITAKAALDVRYLPRLPVPIDGINDSNNVAWKMLDDNIGYIYVRRIRGDLPEQLDTAVKELKKTDGLIIDVRGNSFGGFDAERAVRNFNLNDGNEPNRPRYTGKIAMLIDSRCISAGEGWASWFQANDRATFFGETTAGASGRKTVVDVMGGLYQVRFPVKAYKGFLDRPIERRGLEPNVAVRPNSRDLANGVDTIFESAKAHLLKIND